MLINGWGANIKQEANIFFPNSNKDCQEILVHNSIIPRGMGRSYGDSAIFNNVLHCFWAIFYESVVGNFV